MNESDRRKVLITQMKLLGEVHSTETALFHQTAAAKYGLGITDMKALSVLLWEGSMTAGQLARRLNLTSGAVTSVIDRLSNKDFVKRIPDHKDRRKVIVSVNQEKLSAGENVYHSMGMAFEELLMKYSVKQLEFLVEFYEASIELTKLECKKLANS